MVEKSKLGRRDTISVTKPMVESEPENNDRENEKLRIRILRKLNISMVYNITQNEKDKLQGKNNGYHIGSARGLERR